MKGVAKVLSHTVMIPRRRASSATALKSTPDRNVIVEGHTDSAGARSFNMDLATARAQSVREYIVSRGVPADMIRAVGIGPDRPVADNKTADGRANNRRVEIIIEGAGFTR